MTRKKLKQIGLAVAMVIGVLIVIALHLWVDFASRAPNVSPPANLAGFQAACTGNQTYPSSRAYKTGQPPYPVAVIAQSTAEAKPSYQTSILYAADPTTGLAVRLASPVSAQLIACVDRVSATTTDKTCSYLNTNLPVYEATYRLNVYEAKTHKRVLSQDIASVPINVSPDPRVLNQCPLETPFDPNDPRIYTAPSIPQVSAALTSLIR